MYGLIAGLHTFEFQPSKLTPGCTTFVQWESFTGAGTWLMSEWLVGGGIKKYFVGFNEDLKVEAEKKT
jgi:hypothetical protein